MSTRTTLGYAVLRRWKDNPTDFQVLEYCKTKQEAEAWIHQQPTSHLYTYEVGAYE